MDSSVAERFPRLAARNSFVHLQLFAIDSAVMYVLRLIIHLAVSVCANHVVTGHTSCHLEWAC